MFISCAPICLFLVFCIVWFKKTCPEIKITGTESIQADETPVKVFVPPGPVVTKQQPMLLFALA